MMSQKRIERVENHLSWRERRTGDERGGVESEGVAGVRVGGGADLNEIKRRVASWEKYLFQIAPERIAQFCQQRKERQKESFEERFDVIVVGFGAAGAAAALDAADRGCSVLVIDRFDGGGSTRRSGGVYYAGAGTRAQKENGIADDVENMAAYIKKENNGAVDEATILSFCKNSPETFAWLEDRVGMSFKDAAGRHVLLNGKTSYPPNHVNLYQSGNEGSFPHVQFATPAPRGHRVTGDHLTGNQFFIAFQRQVEQHPNITLRLHTSAQELMFDNVRNRCTGIFAKTLVQDSTVESMHVMLHEIGSAAPMFDPSRKFDRQCRALEAELFVDLSTSHQFYARQGVILATGGFFFNEDMVKAFSPKYDGFMPLGNLGDDGAGILMAQRIGAKLGRMDRCSAWKFVNPPSSFIHGVVVNTKGERVGNEDQYGATLADNLIQKHGGKGWLIIDQTMWTKANETCLDESSGLQEDQKMQGLANLHRNRKIAASWTELAKEIGVSEKTLASTIQEYNTFASQKRDTGQGKNKRYLYPLQQPPFYAINMDMVGNKYWPTPCMTLGGVVVDGATGQVIHSESDTPIEGLYAAGRCAVGIASNSYISGLSLADCVFSGRRAGQHVAAQKSVTRQDKQAAQPTSQHVPV